MRGLGGVPAISTLRQETPPGADDSSGLEGFEPTVTNPAARSLSRIRRSRQTSAAGFDPSIASRTSASSWVTIAYW